jgi:S1-C subfamily serine protease
MFSRAPGRAARSPWRADILPAVPFDEEAEEGQSGFRPPPHPDDRLWRHPSEMRTHPIVQLNAPERMRTERRAPRPGPHDANRSGRPRWATAALAGAAGAVLAVGAVAVLGFGERVIERPVIERVALNPVNSHPGLEGPTLDGVRQRVAPALVGIVTAPAGGALGSSGEVIGSGVVIRDDGIVVTSAALVAPGVDPVRLRLPDGTEKPARVVGTDPATGLSVVDLDGRGYTASVLAGEGDLVSGETSYAVSARIPVGTETTTGVVGVTQRYVGPSGSALDGVQIDGEAPALGLGSPMVDDRGAVVGITTALDEGGAWYVAPVEVVRKVADDLLIEGYVRTCWLGIEGIDAPAAGVATSTVGGGTRVASVVAGSPAAAAGLRAGDVVVRFDDHVIARMPDLLVALRAYSPGEEVEVEVTRDDGSRATLHVTLAEPPTS